MMIPVLPCQSIDIKKYEHYKKSEVRACVWMRYGKNGMRPFTHLLKHKFVFYRRWDGHDGWWGPV